MKISVVMATYNGDPYIEEQLKSIRDQKMKPTEVLIFDDGSRDNTVRKIQSFILENHLESFWNLYTNSFNKGWRKNFIDAFNQAQGDLIFPCDQDDIWFNDKIEKMTKIMIANNDIELLISNYTSIKDEPRYEMSDEKLNQPIQIAFNQKYGKIIKPGCTFCFRKKIVKDMTQYWNSEIAHDGLIWTYCVLRGSAYRTSLKTLFWRRHENNNSPQFDRNWSGRIKQIERRKNYVNIAKKIITYSCNSLSTEEKINRNKIINEELIFMNLREEYFREKNVLLLFLIVKYRKYYWGVRNMIGDISLVFING